MVSPLNVVVLLLGRIHSLITVFLVIVMFCILRMKNLINILSKNRFLVSYNANYDNVGIDAWSDFLEECMTTKSNLSV